ncbi:MAG: acyltransferase [Candidatus Latescibacteria bacterium]|nr:acyltransferase [Candidatus Latescibacterota bacterium]
MNALRFKNTIDRLFEWFPLYKAIVGGYRYYNSSKCRYNSRQFLKYGNDVRICDNVEIVFPERLAIGNGVFIGPRCLISATGGVNIGNYTGIAEGCLIFTVEHRHYGAETIPVDDVRMIKPVWIEDFVWIGMKVSILPGVKIGEGAIVGLGSVVNKDVKPLSVVMGNPIQVIGNRDKNSFDKMKAERKIRAPSRPTRSLWIPPLSRNKYSKELLFFGFGENHFKGIFADRK